MNKVHLLESRPAGKADRVGARIGAGQSTNPIDSMAVTVGYFGKTTPEGAPWQAVAPALSITKGREKIEIVGMNT